MKNYEKKGGSVDIYPIIGGLMVLLSWVVLVWLAISTGFMAWSVEEFNKIVSTPSTVSDFKTK